MNDWKKNEWTDKWLHSKTSKGNKKSIFESCNENRAALEIQNQLHIKCTKNVNVSLIIKFENCLTLRKVTAFQVKVGLLKGHTNHWLPWLLYTFMNVILIQINVSSVLMFLLLILLLLFSCTLLWQRRRQIAVLLVLVLNQNMHFILLMKTW